MGYKCVGLLGDSIGQGYFSDTNDGWFGKLIAKLNQDKPREYASQNMAVSGERIIDAYHRFHMEAMTKNLGVLFIAIGTNDLIRWDSMDTQTDISPGLRDEMWGKLLPAVKKNIGQIFILSLLPVIESFNPLKGVFNRPLYYLNSDIEKYNEFLKQISKKYDIQFIDIASSFLKNDLGSLFEDGAHPNEKGHQLIADEVYRQVKGKV